MYRLVQSLYLFMNAFKANGHNTILICECITWGNWNSIFHVCGDNWVSGFCNGAHFSNCEIIELYWLYKELQLIYGIHTIDCQELTPVYNIPREQGIFLF